ncbi:MAG: transglycosylase domain-containing protein [Paracoccaceae bacterium]|jgi:membrane peptidoglycan carboxypeptidase|nr:transglycosylase domain-containing protein [Paracoccaceae bacterium]MDP7186422.1 transglycosylase domain-containing protein [Paracoccaceae bacterium]
MTSKKPQRPRLVADKRYESGKKPAAKKPAPKKPAAKKPVPKKRTSKKAAKRRPLLLRLLFGLIRTILLIIWRLGWRLAVIVALLIGGSVAYYLTSLPPIEDLIDGRARGSVTLLDREGEVFAWRGDQFGGMITTDTVSPHLKNAVVATEDKRFYYHVGVDPIGIASAVRINLSEGRGPLEGHGGSTITQQVAKLLCVGTPFDPRGGQTEAEYEAECRQSTLWRKITEATYALAMELKYSKDEILTIYMNRVFLGAGSRGFEAASQRYFGKSAAEVSPAEAALLAGLLVAPSRYAPTNNLTRSQNRAGVIIDLMEAQGLLSATDAAIAKQIPAVLSEAAEAQAGGYFADWVMAYGPDYLTQSTTEDVIIQTTLDQSMQAAAEEAMAQIIEERLDEDSKAQVAIVVMSADGAVRAMVGGRRTKVAGAFNRVTQAKRQTGSAFKPFVYGAALEMGYRYNDIVVDEPITINIPGSGDWSPSNYTNENYGEVTLTDALRNSLNIPAVKVSETVGRDAVRQIATDFGLRGPLAEGPALALGASEATLINMTGAFAGILNGGSSVQPYGLLELRLAGDDVPLMGKGGGIGERVLRESVAQELIYMMRQVVTRGSGKRANLPDREVAGKTGTTQAARDAWFIGFTADYVAGVWMGYDDNTPLTGVTGGSLPAEIWKATMERIHENVPVRPLPMMRPEEELPGRAFGDEIIETQPEPDNDPVLIQILRDLLGG